MAYTGWLLRDESREVLMGMVPPSFPDVIAHHITQQYPVDKDADAPKAVSARVVGIARDESLECLVVEVDGSVLREDGKHYHITWSLDKSAGREPRESAAVIAEKGWEKLMFKVPIKVEPQLFL